MLLLLHTDKIIIAKHSIQGQQYMGTNSTQLSLLLQAMPITKYLIWLQFKHTLKSDLHDVNEFFLVSSGLIMLIHVIEH